MDQLNNDLDRIAAMDGGVKNYQPYKPVSILMFLDGKNESSNAQLTYQQGHYQVQLPAVETVAFKAPEVVPTAAPVIEPVSTKTWTKSTTHICDKTFIIKKHYELYENESEFEDPNKVELSFINTQELMQIQKITTSDYYSNSNKADSSSSMFQDTSPTMPSLFTSPPLKRRRKTNDDSLFFESYGGLSMNGRTSFFSNFNTESLFGDTSMLRSSNMLTDSEPMDIDFQLNSFKSPTSTVVQEEDFPNKSIISIESSIVEPQIKEEPITENENKPLSSQTDDFVCLTLDFDQIGMKKVNTLYTASISKKNSQKVPKIDKLNPNFDDVKKVINNEVKNA